MALTHHIIETRQEGNRWRTLLRVVDSNTGKDYIRTFQSRTDPDQARLDELGVLAETRIQTELDYDANAMNLSTDEDRLLEYYRGIMRDIILQIRQFPNATLQQAQDYITAEYPDSPFNFAELYAIWKRMVGVATWDEFKKCVIDHKFREID